jgi:hypothetical protein
MIMVKLFLDLAATKTQPMFRGLAVGVSGQASSNALISRAVKKLIESARQYVVASAEKGSCLEAEGKGDRTVKLPLRVRGCI